MGNQNSMETEIRALRQQVDQQNSKLDALHTVIEQLTTVLRASGVKLTVAPIPAPDLQPEVRTQRGEPNPEKSDVDDETLTRRAKNLRKSNW